MNSGHVGEGIVLRFEVFEIEMRKLARIVVFSIVVSDYNEVVRILHGKRIEQE